MTEIYNLLAERLMGLHHFCPLDQAESSAAHRSAQNRRVGRNDGPAPGYCLLVRFAIRRL